MPSSTKKNAVRIYYVRADTHGLHRVEVHLDHHVVVRYINYACGLQCSTFETAIELDNGGLFPGDIDIMDYSSSDFVIRVGNLTWSMIPRFCSSLIPAEYSP